MKLVFAGTPEFAAVAMQALIDAGHEIVLVLTQPDRPAGRGMKLAASPVKDFALAHGLALAQPAATEPVRYRPQDVSFTMKGGGVLGDSPALEDLVFGDAVLPLSACRMSAEMLHTLCIDHSTQKAQCKANSTQKPDQNKRGQVFPDTVKPHSLTRKIQRRKT